MPKTSKWNQVVHPLTLAYQINDHKAQAHDVTQIFIQHHSPAYALYLFIYFLACFLVWFYLCFF